MLFFSPSGYLPDDNLNGKRQPKHTKQPETITTLKQSTPKTWKLHALVSLLSFFDFLTMRFQPRLNAQK